LNYIQKNYKGGLDVVECLRQGKAIDLDKEAPTRAISTLDADKGQAVEQAGFDIKYQEELRRHLDRKDALRQGLAQAYALIFGTYCTKTMQQRVEGHPDFDSKL